MKKFTTKEKIRVIVRPWVPKIIPFEIPMDTVEKILIDVYQKLQRVVYVGWVKRKDNGKNRLYYLAATADTVGEARHLFKTSEAYGRQVWKLHE